MKASEFITERKKQLNHRHKDVLPKAQTFSGADHYYDMYRLGIMAAGLPDYETASEGPASDSPTMWAYTDVEDQMIQDSAKAMGFKNKVIVRGKSAESKDTHTVSPVSNWMKT
jgi:hypothetical protein